MFVVTGGFGFIGSNIIRSLNSQGIDDIIVVDNIPQDERYQNLSGCRYADLVVPDEFSIKKHGWIKATFHQGAETDTGVSMHAAYMKNFLFSKKILTDHLDAFSQVPFVYASSAAVYGNSKSFREDASADEQPLNPYAFTKLAFDNFVRKYTSFSHRVYGLRYFNVYGDGESHKGKMASMITQLMKADQIQIFCPSASRDFVHVDDVVETNLRFALDFGDDDRLRCCPPDAGIFNVGTGVDRTFDDIAGLVAKKRKKKYDIIEMPEGLRPKYQFMTRADTTRISSALGWKPSIAVEDGIERYRSC